MLPIVIITALATTACVGRPANPIAVNQLGDEGRSCESLLAEMSQIEATIAARLPETYKTGKNTALAVAGAFFIVPWFLMDFTQSEKIEIEALRNRYIRLNSIAAGKKCEGITQP
jgi:hypothetical protein